MTAWQIPEPLATGWQMRTPDSAKISAHSLDDGRFRQTIEHAPLPGVTPAMCLWYLERLDRTLTWENHTTLGYRLWHPRDHIFFARHGPFGPGSRWHIVEAFGAERRFLLDQVFRVTQLGDTGFTMEIRKLGQPVAIVDERWRPTPAGLVWTVEMTVGTTAPGSRAVTRRIVRRRMVFLNRWRQHNVEEVGNLPHFLPDLYNQGGD
jgi:hypothetical protein